MEISPESAKVFKLAAFFEIHGKLTQNESQKMKDLFLASMTRLGGPTDHHWVEIVYAVLLSDKFPTFEIYFVTAMGTNFTPMQERALQYCKNAISLL
jgi:hypothetical protein